MTREELFDAWAPAGGPWSDWAKPVLFAHWPRPLPDVPADVPAFDLSWVPRPDEPAALVIDLPGAESVRLGLAVAGAGAGYRPVPLFNAVPPPAVESPTPGPAVVPVEPILAALIRGADRLRESAPPADAPPAFLLDADRQTPTRDLAPGAFDNRSVVFVTDFPSAVRLAAHGVRRAVLVRNRSGPIGDDLADALRTWQTDGLQLDVKWLSEPGPPVPLALPRWGWWAQLWRWWTVTVRLRRDEAGGFGRFIPHPSSG
jgi:hypothetical protein